MSYFDRSQVGSPESTSSGSVASAEMYSDEVPAFAGAGPPGYSHPHPQVPLPTPHSYPVRPAYSHAYHPGTPPEYYGSRTTTPVPHQELIKTEPLEGARAQPHQHQQPQQQSPSQLQAQHLATRLEGAYGEPSSFRPHPTRGVTSWDRGSPSPQQWDEMKPFIQQRYMIDEISLKQVQQEMVEYHGFHASARMYKRQFKAWKWQKYNRTSRSVAKDDKTDKSGKGRLRERGDRDSGPESGVLKASRRGSRHGRIEHLRRRTSGSHQPTEAPPPPPPPPPPPQAPHPRHEPDPRHPHGHMAHHYGPTGTGYGGPSLPLPSNYTNPSPSWPQQYGSAPGYYGTGSGDSYSQGGEYGHGGGYGHGGFNQMATVGSQVLFSSTGVPLMETHGLTQCIDVGDGVAVLEQGLGCQMEAYGRVKMEQASSTRLDAKACVLPMGRDMPRWCDWRGTQEYDLAKGRVKIKLQYREEESFDEAEDDESLPDGVHIKEEPYSPGSSY